MEIVFEETNGYSESGGQENDKIFKRHFFHSIPVQLYMIKSPESSQNVTIRNLQTEDLNKIVNTFTFPWSSFEDTLKLWEQWFKEQQEGIRTVCVLERHNQFLGHGSLLRVSEYSYFREKGIPDVNALWMDEPFRRQGLGKKLIEHLEDMARHEGYKIIGIGVGLYKDYGPAQKLYFKMGYQPDGNGITYKGNWVEPRELLLMDLEEPLVVASQMYFIKNNFPEAYQAASEWFFFPLAEYYSPVLEAYLESEKPIDDEFIKNCAMIHRSLAENKDDKESNGSVDN